MKRAEHGWYSKVLGRDMRLVQYGHFGKPLILFPTAGGDHLDNERFKLIESIRPLIEAGRVKVYSCSSISSETWCDSHAAPWHKSWLQDRFHDYLKHELIPAVRADCGGVAVAVAGASLGGYNAVNSACRQPGTIDLAIGLSGTYDFDRWMGRHRDLAYYFNQPLAFVPNLPESDPLQALRGVTFVLASGSGRYEAPDESRRLAAILRSKGVRQVHLELWDADWHHDWPTWRAMLPLFLDKLLP
ncbi:MAG: hypothetical protein EA397_01805 [Deltaproteobacteria bacterium]|nr:MAG: hypothetical protein EA397_01805 [Deltaproteobacteria bacterium]